MRSFAGDAIGRGRRPAINAAPADIKADIRANNDRRKVGERRRSMIWTHPCLTCSLSPPVSALLDMARAEGLLQRLNTCASGGGRIQRVYQPGLPSESNAINLSRLLVSHWISC